MSLLPDFGAPANSSGNSLANAVDRLLIWPKSALPVNSGLKSLGARGLIVPSVVYQGPITITQGGAYTGNYRSTSSATPAVTIATSAPVTLLNCVLVGPGDLIQANGAPADLTILHCRAYGTVPTRSNRGRGRFVAATNARNIRAEHNYLEHTTGFTIYRFSGDGSANQTVRILRNRVRNVDGRTRNGGTQIANFVGLNTVRNLPGIEIAWNQVINEPNLSSVEDNINLYNSGGTAQSPARVHDNYVQGAYPFPATAATFTGTGMTTDGTPVPAVSQIKASQMTATQATALLMTNRRMTTAFVNAYNNQFVSTCNAAMNIAAGHDIHYYNNRLVTSARLPDGTALRAVHAATAVFNGTQASSAIFFNNTVRNNTIGYRNPAYSIPYPGRHDLSNGACATCTGTVHLPNPITLATEQNELALWQQKLIRNRVKIGPDAALIESSNVLGSAAPALSLYPNPVTAETLLQLPVDTAEILELGIYTPQGRLAGSQRVRAVPQGPGVPLATAALPVGPYVLRVLSGSLRGQSLRFAKE
ncbi:hypothetical protein I2I05_02555 [Hymenobacter sp. BT683]|uniref:T9SS type A sorting domain-containing protein n=1 Tax=Hymenobacter jeongseonensis TaxID=2791027 RepID=A0ABS0ID40_9BACT|nr:hypothetical protein [Hymenobacter jeongseonensis]MBF9236267.1 hypothetical protein [Hymenobacter jeongseonensis]